MSTVHRSICALLLGAATTFALRAHAEDAPSAPSKHQLMKECMAKQKASESGKNRADMRAACKDVTKTEKQNDDRAASDAPASPQK